MFNAAYKRVLDEESSEALRYLAFRQCVEFYCWLTKQKFQETFSRIGGRYGFSWEKKPDKLQLVNAANHLKVERVTFLAKLKEFKTVRREQKARGQRSPRKDQLKKLYAPDWIK